MSINENIKYEIYSSGDEDDGKAVRKNMKERAKQRWPKNKTSELIIDLRSHGCLWDVTSPAFNDRDKKEQALNTLGAKYGCPAKEIKRKKASLRSQLIRELKNMAKPQNGDGIDGISQWEHWDALQFLLPTINFGKSPDSIPISENSKHSIQRRSMSEKRVGTINSGVYKLENVTITSDNKKDEISQTSQNSDRSEESIRIPENSHNNILPSPVAENHLRAINSGVCILENVSSSDDKRDEISHPCKTTFGKIADGIRISEDSQDSILPKPTISDKRLRAINSGVCILENVTTPDDKRDEISHFCKNLDEKLKRMDYRERILVEKKINDIVFEAELNSLSQREMVRRGSMCTTSYDNEF